MNDIQIDIQIEERLENALKDIYFISGLGADERVFRLLRFEGYHPVHIRWLRPERGESLHHYARRLTAQIQAERPIVIGLSFGAIVATEIANHIDVDKVILISGVKHQSEIPFYFKFFRWFPLHRFFPFKTLLWAGYWLLNWLFGLETVAERQLLKAILQDTDAWFLKWALHQVVIWRNDTVRDNFYHIHGSNDRIFPIRWIEPDFVVDRGGHLMVVSQAVPISMLIEKIIG